MKGNTVKALVEKICSDDEAERMFAVEDILDQHLDGFAVHLLERLMIEHSPAVRDTIVCALREMANEEIYEKLFQLFQSTDAFLRNAAVDIFGAGGEHAVSFLAMHLDHANREIRKLILDSMFQTGTESAKLAIRASLHDSDLNVKITAIEYIGRLEDRSSVEDMLRTFETEENPMVRSSILESLSLIGNGEQIREILEILAPDGDFSGVDPIYIPEILDLVSKTGNLKDVRAVMEDINDTRLYAGVILKAAGIVTKRIIVLSELGWLTKIISSIALCPEIDENERYDAVTGLLDGEFGSLKEEILFDMGVGLAAEKRMQPAAVLILAKCGLHKSRNLIEKIRDETDNRELSIFCGEVLEQ